MNKYITTCRDKQYGPFTATNKEQAKSIAWWVLRDVYSLDVDRSEILVSEPTTESSNRPTRKEKA